MKTYTFQVVIEEDEWLDERIKDPVWRAYIPELVHQGASSWGYTQKEALKNLQDAVDLLIESLLEHGEEHLLEAVVQHEKQSDSESSKHNGRKRILSVLGCFNPLHAQLNRKLS